MKEQFTKTKLCPFFIRGHCNNGVQCSYAHAQLELRPLPDLQNTKLCESVTKGYICKAADCAYAHSRDDLRVTTDLVAFKTALCFFHKKGKCMNGDKCRFAHGSNELKSSIKSDDSADEMSQIDSSDVPIDSNLKHFRSTPMLMRSVSGGNATNSTVACTPSSASHFGLRTGITDLPSFPHGVDVSGRRSREESSAFAIGLSPRNNIKRIPHDYKSYADNSNIESNPARGSVKDTRHRRSFGQYQTESFEEYQEIPSTGEGMALGEIMGRNHKSKRVSSQPRRIANDQLAESQSSVAVLPSSYLNRSTNPLQQYKLEELSPTVSLPKSAGKHNKRKVNNDSPMSLPHRYSVQPCLQSKRNFQMLHNDAGHYKQGSSVSVPSSPRVMSSATYKVGLEGAFRSPAMVHTQPCAPAYDEFNSNHVYLSPLPPNATRETDVHKEGLMATRHSSPSPPLAPLYYQVPTSTPASPRSFTFSRKTNQRSYEAVPVSVLPPIHPCAVPLSPATHDHQCGTTYFDDTQHPTLHHPSPLHTPFAPASYYIAAPPHIAQPASQSVGYQQDIDDPNKFPNSTPDYPRTTQARHSQNYARSNSVPSISETLTPPASACGSRANSFRNTVAALPIGASDEGTLLPPLMSEMPNFEDANDESEPDSEVDEDGGSSVCDGGEDGEEEYYANGEVDQSPHIYSPAMREHFDQNQHHQSYEETFNTNSLIPSTVRLSMSESKGNWSAHSGKVQYQSNNYRRDSAHFAEQHAVQPTQPTQHSLAVQSHMTTQSQPIQPFTAVPLGAPVPPASSPSANGIFMSTSCPNTPSFFFAPAPPYGYPASNQISPAVPIWAPPWPQPQPMIPMYSTQSPVSHSKYHYGSPAPPMDGSPAYHPPLIPSASHDNFGMVDYSQRNCHAANLPIRNHSMPRLNLQNDPSRISSQNPMWYGVVPTGNHTHPISPEEGRYDQVNTHDVHHETWRQRHGISAFQSTPEFTVNQASDLEANHAMNRHAFNHLPETSPIIYDCQPNFNTQCGAGCDGNESRRNSVSKKHSKENAGPMQPSSENTGKCTMSPASAQGCKTKTREEMNCSRGSPTSVKTPGGAKREKMRSQKSKTVRSRIEDLDIQEPESSECLQMNSNSYGCGDEFKTPLNELNEATDADQTPTTKASEADVTSLTTESIKNGNLGRRSHSDEIKKKRSLEISSCENFGSASHPGVRRKASSDSKQNLSCLSNPKIKNVKHCFAGNSTVDKMKDQQTPNKGSYSFYGTIPMDTQFTVLSSTTDRESLRSSTESLDLYSPQLSSSARFSDDPTTTSAQMSNENSVNSKAPGPGFVNDFFAVPAAALIAAQPTFYEE